MNKKFTKEQTNKACAELFKSGSDFINDHGFTFLIMREYNIDVLRVARLKDKEFWLSTIKIQDDNQDYHHHNYRHDDLSMSILGAFLLSKGYRP